MHYPCFDFVKFKNYYLANPKLGGLNLILDISNLSSVYTKFNVLRYKKR